MAKHNNARGIYQRNNRALARELVRISYERNSPLSEDILDSYESEERIVRTRMDFLE